METFLASVWSVMTDTVWPLIMFIIGLDVVVFFHEAGHFLAARWAGIKVERFAIGMGPRLFGIVLGETDYCFCALPIGGYVKMLGQEDFAPQKDGALAAPDPRSFNAATVGKRMVVISAGVVMNVILAAILFITVCMIGKDYIAPIVGFTVPDYPAAMAKIEWQGAAPPAADNPNDDKTCWVGLQPGDEILTIDGEEVTRFNDLQVAAILASEDEQLPIAFERQIGDKKYLGRTDLSVKMLPGLGVLAFGIAPPSSLVIGDLSNLILKSPLETNDHITAINGKKVEYHWQIKPIVKKLAGWPTTVTVLRKVDGAQKSVDVTVQPFIISSPDVLYRKDGSRLEGKILEDKDNVLRIKTKDDKTIEAPIADLAGGHYFTILDILGLVPRLKVSSVYEDSPARQAGLQPGDIIKGYADHPTPTLRQFRKISDDVLGDKTRITVLRDGKSMTLAIAPEKKGDNAIVGIIQTSDLEHPVVAAVREGSPTAKAGIVAGAEIVAINNQKIHSWIDLLEALKKIQEQTSDSPVTLTTRLGAEEKTCQLGKLNKNVFRNDDYQARLFTNEAFRPLTVTIVHRNPLAAIAWGAEETFRLILSTYGTLRSMLCGSVSTKAVSGPVGIARAAIAVGRNSLLDLVNLMAIISASLAVINFLPLPVLDGGHAVLLIIEKVRRKPLPMKLINIIQMTGLVLILGLFIVLTWNDIAQWIAG